MTPTENRIKILQEQLEVEKQNLKEERANKEFVCGCGKYHKIKDCVVIQTHWYTAPSGCSDGDYWNSGELQIVCPDTDFKNRILFKNFNIPWEKRNLFDYDASAQFSRIYKYLFKAVVDDYDKDRRKAWNNYWVDNNHEYYGIKIGD
jgi:hypothetical protein